MTLHVLFERLILAILMVGSLFGVWVAVLWLGNIEPWLLPSPLMVWQTFEHTLSHKNLLFHLWITTWEIFAGYLIGNSLGLIMGYGLSQCRWLEKIMTPYLIAGNSVPLVAVAPLLILWLGPGVTTKVVVTALIVFLPMVISTHSGFRTQRQIFLRLMHALHANKWQRFIHLEWPTALPSILSGLKIGAPLSVVGAVVGEFLGADRGLGFLILEANQRLDTPQLFVVILILAALGTLFYTSIHGLEILVLGNRRRSEH